MSKLSKLGSLREQLAEVRSERDRFQQALRRLVPGIRGRLGKPDAGWETIIRLLDHLAELRWMAEPTRAAVYGSSSGSADTPVYPGITLADDGAGPDFPDGDGVTNKGNRNLYHGGQPFERQAERVLEHVDRVVVTSLAWVKGVDPKVDDLPKVRRPRCRFCKAEMGLVWRYCAICGHPAETLEAQTG